MHKSSLTIDSCRQHLDEIIFGSSSLPNSEVPNPDLGLVGIELEVFPYQITGNKEKAVAPGRFNEGSLSLKEVFLKVSEDFGGKALYEKNSDPEIGEELLKKIEFPNGDNFQFEPGGQVEIIINPCKDLMELESRLHFKQSILAKITSEYGIHFTQHGTNPYFGTEEIGLQVQKARYLHLQNYLDGISKYGRMMMRQTGSLQINLDLGNTEETRVKRIIAANLLSPIATALFANSSFTAGKINGLKSYRSFIWQQLDPKRTGILPLKNIDNSWSKENVLIEYFKFSMNAPLVYIDRLPDVKVPSDFTFRNWLKKTFHNQTPDLGDYNHHLSLLFPEVRLRKYLELRSIDAPPEEWQIVPVYFYIGLLYNSKYLEKLLDLLLPHKNEIENLYKTAVFGVEDDKLFNLSKKIMKLSIEGFKEIPSAFKDEKQTAKLISFFEHFTLKRKSFSDESLLFYQK